MTKSVPPKIDPEIGARMGVARLMHKHSLFSSLALKPVLIGKGKASFSVSLTDDFLGVDGKIHSVLLTIIMDSIFGITVFTALEKLKPIATVNLRTDYIGSAVPGRRAVCAAECVSIREEIAFITGDVRSAETGDLLALGSGTFMVGTKTAVAGSRL